MRKILSVLIILTFSFTLAQQPFYYLAPAIQIQPVLAPAINPPGVQLQVDESDLRNSRGLTTTEKASISLMSPEYFGVHEEAGRKVLIYKFAGVYYRVDLTQYVGATSQTVESFIATLPSIMQESIRNSINNSK